MRAAPTHRLGITPIELLVVASVIAMIVMLIVTSLMPVRRGGHGTRSLKDKTQIVQIHKTTLALAHENNGRFPLPGAAGADSDFAHNHSAPLYSYMIAQNLFNADLLIGASEVSPAVRVKEDYNYEAYDAAAGTYWDSSFQARIDDVKIGSNTSYAHAALCGDRLSRLNAPTWRGLSDSGLAVFGTRGTRDGVASGPEYDRSPTLRLHGSTKSWMGHVCFNDNHVETFNDFYMTLAKYKNAQGNLVRDNFFAAEFPHPNGNHAAGDSFLGIFIGSTEFTVNPIYDPLD